MLKLLFCFVLLEAYVMNIAVAGSVIEVGGLKSYVSGSPHVDHAVILASDILGYRMPNLRAIADKVAAAGYYVVVPDFFNGDPYDPNNPKRPMDKWLKSHPTERGVEDAKAVIRALRKRGFSSIGVTGFCWGGKVAAVLSSTTEIQAAVLCHPVNVTLTDIKDVKVPIAILGAELDTVCPKELVKQYKEVLLTKPEIKSYVKIFRGVDHGFTVMYDLSDKKAVKAAERAHMKILDWFNKSLK